MTKQATIKDIARLAGVAPSTVSRVVTNSPGVGAQTRMRIWKLIEEHNYRPNSVARSLVTQRLRTIGILVPLKRGKAFFENPFFADVLMGASEAAAQRNYDVLLYTASREQTNVLQERKVDGVLAVGLREDDRLLPHLKNQDMRVVFINREIDDQSLTWVSVDNRQGACKAVLELIRLGHRRIGFIGGPNEMRSGKLRRQGYLDALGERGIDICPDLLTEGNFDEESGLECALKLLSLRPRPTAIFAANDLMAIGALKAAKTLKIKVPNELSLCGFDNIHSCLHTDPPLSTVKMPAFKMGQLACQMMLALLSGGEPEARQILLPTELVRRESMGKIGG